MNIRQRPDGAWEFVESDWGWLGWIDFRGEPYKTALDCAVELADICPDATDFFCSVGDYLRGNGKGACTTFFGRSSDKRYRLTTDASLPDGQVHACKRPPKLAVDVGATWT